MIVVAGEALVDLVVAAGGIEAVPGGAPYNVARCCGRLGAPVALWATLSGDVFGRQLVRELAAAGVSDALVQHTDRPTTLALAELDGSGSATYRFYVEGTSAPALDPIVLPPDVDVFVTGGLGLAVEPMAASIEAALVGAAGRVRVVVDVNCRPAIVADRDAYVARLERVLARTDVVKASDDDLAWLRPGAPPEEAARELLGFGPTAVLVTCGADPTLVVTRGGTDVVPVAPVTVVDTIGAGDAFTAGFVVAWRATGELLPAVDAAHAAAASVVSRRGAGF